jgi:hypothetical protein
MGVGGCRWTTPPESSSAEQAAAKDAINTAAPAKRNHRRIPHLHLIKNKQPRGVAASTAHFSVDGMSSFARHANQSMNPAHIERRWPNRH